MIRQLTAVALALGASAFLPAHAATFDLTLKAADGSRWYEYFSDAYAELGSDWGEVSNPNSDDFGKMADGFYLISSPGTKIGSGVVVFEQGSSFANIGSLSYDAGSGAITGLTLDFAPFIANDNSTIGGSYSTAMANVSGSVLLVGGEVAGIELDSDITFTYSTRFGQAPYSGSFSISGDRFVLDVDDTNPSLFGDFRYAWDVSGTVANLAPIPEPSTYALMVGGLLAVGAIVRRRAPRA